MTDPEASSSEPIGGLKERQSVRSHGSPIAWWFRDATPTQRVRHFIYLLGVLLLLISGIAVLTLRSHSKEVDQLTLTITSAIDSNNQVLQAMTDAEIGLIGFQASHDPLMLALYRGAHTRTMSALAASEENLVLSSGQNVANDIKNMEILKSERQAAEQWWSFGLDAEQILIEGGEIDNFRNVVLFDKFREFNITLGENLETQRGDALNAARANSTARTTQIIVATLLALAAILILGNRYARSVSQPITGLRDTMSRLRKGDSTARAREDLGSQEIRSLAVAFNALANESLTAQNRVKDTSARLSSLAGLSWDADQEVSLDALLHKTVALARNLFDARYAAIAVLNETGTGLADLVTEGLTPEEKNRILSLPPETRFLAGLLADPRVERIEHLAQDPRTEKFSRQFPEMDSFLSVPIIRDKKPFGVLILVNKIGGPFAIEDEQIAIGFALHMVVDIDHVRRYESELVRANKLEAVQEIEHAIHATSGTQEALDVLCVALGKRLGVDRVNTTTIAGEHRLDFNAEWHRPNLSPLGPMPHYMAQHNARFAEALWRSAGRRVTNDYLAIPVQTEATQVFLSYTNARAAIIVPILVGDLPGGLICVTMDKEPRQWTESEIFIVEDAALFVGRIIVNAQYQFHQSEHIERLERLERQQSRWVATVSHELRTPLTSITGYLELLNDEVGGNLTADQKKMVEVMNRNTIRLSKLIDNLLVFKQNEREGTKFEIDDVSMRTLIVETCQELLSVANNKSVELHADLCSEEAIVQGQREQLKNAITNIISNAIKFSKPRSAVSVSCAVYKDTGLVHFRCSDRGIGVPTADQDQLFNRFYRASNASRGEIPGTGLGLSIVKQIVTDHGGQVRLTSVEGEGTTVVIDLPLALIEVGL